MARLTSIRTWSSSDSILKKLQNSPEAQAFYAAIREEPGDDTRSLIFADWLEEQGIAEWAELIRVQIALEATPSWEVRSLELRNREHILFKACVEALRPPEIPGVVWGPLKKGMVRSVFINETKGLQHLETITTLTPASRLVFDLSRRLKHLVDCAETPGSKLIKFREWEFLPSALRTVYLQPIVEAIPATNLISLDLGQNPIGTGAAKMLATTQTLKHLRSLNLFSCDVGILGLKALLMSPILAHLEALNLRECHIRYSHPTWPQSFRMIKSLKRLDLSANGIHSDEYLVFFNAPFLENLEELFLRSAGVDDESVERLTSIKTLSKLVRLDLSYNKISPGALCKLLASTYLTSLRFLSIVGLELGKACVRELLESPGLSNLKHVQISKNQANTHGLLPQLEEKFGVGLVKVDHATHETRHGHHNWATY